MKLNNFTRKEEFIRDFACAIVEFATQQNGGKATLNLTYESVAAAVPKVPRFGFLRGLFPEKIRYRDYLAKCAAGDKI